MMDEADNSKIILSGLRNWLKDWFFRVEVWESVKMFLMKRKEKKLALWLVSDNCPGILSNNINGKILN